MAFFIDISLLKTNRNFRLVFAGQFISFIGTMVTKVAIPYQIYHQTQSLMMVGLMSLCELLPLLVTALIGGALADRYHRRQLLIITELLMTLGCVGLLLNASLPTPQIWLVFVIGTFLSAINGLHRPALDSIIQQVVDRDDMDKVGALATVKYSIAMIGGPAIGGILIAELGLTLTYLVDVLSYIASLSALLLMSHIPKPERVKDQSTWAALKEGFQYAIARQELLGSYFVDILAMIFGMPTALFPAIAEAYGGPRALGMLYAAPAVGALIISFVSGWTLNVKRYGAAIGWSAALWGLAIIGFGLAQPLWLALFFLALAGAFDAVSGIFRVTLWNKTISQEFRGRLSGIEMISYLSGPKLGDVEAGLVAAAFGISFSVVSGGVLCVLGVAGCCYYLPKFWRYEST
jgi:MFS family permease